MRMDEQQSMLLTLGLHDEIYPFPGIGLKGVKAIGGSIHERSIVCVIAGMTRFEKDAARFKWQLGARIANHRLADGMLDVDRIHTRLVNDGVLHRQHLSLSP
nr:hypothetical protein [Paenibacillus apiarius]